MKSIGRSGFRLGSGARWPTPRSTTASMCFQPALWLRAGAIMFVLVTANMEVNNPNDFNIPMDDPSTGAEMRPLQDPVQLNKFLGKSMDKDNAPLVHIIAPSDTLVRTTKGRLVSIMKFAMMITTLGTIMLMYNGNENMRGPPWDPNGRVSFREWMSELMPWLALSQRYLGPSGQAAAIQVGLSGIARTFALTIPPAAIMFGAQINGVDADPVTYIIYMLSNRFAQLEDE